ncbi:hypothetical protein Tco_1480842 [Tanacetum coccineum]
MDPASMVYNSDRHHSVRVSRVKKEEKSSCGVLVSFVQTTSATIDGAWVLYQTYWREMEECRVFMNACEIGYVFGMNSRRYVHTWKVQEENQCNIYAAVIWCCSTRLLLIAVKSTLS